MCDESARVGDMFPLLRTAYSVGYIRILFALGQVIAVYRPVLGKLEDAHFSAARAELLDAGEEVLASALHDRENETLVADPERTCDALAKELVTIRKSGRSAWLQLR